jgi:SAM-dependent methyltransferase
MRIRALAALAALSLGLGCGAIKRQMYEGFGRDDWQKPDEVIARLEIEPGDRVADIDDDMIEYLRERAAREGRSNVEVIRGEFGDPLLPDGAVDLVFTSDTYHHLTDRTAYFAKLRKDLAPGARVAILDFNGTRGFAKWFGHSTPKQTIVDEMTAAGYRLVADHDLIEEQHFVVFEPAS